MLDAQLARRVAARRLAGCVLLERDRQAQEPRTLPLSDDKIVTALAEEGIDIARRTVAKYREALGIPSSVERRRRRTGFTRI